MRLINHKKIFTLQVVVVLYLFMIVPLLIFNLQKKQEIQNKAEVLSSETPTITSNVCTNTSNDVMIVLDTSINKPDQAKTTASELVALLSQNAQNTLGLVTFAKDTTLVSPLTGDFSHLQSQIATTSAGQASCLQCAINQANQELTKNKRQGAFPAIILLTDGHANYTLQGLQATASAQQQALYSATNAEQTNGVSIYALALGDDADTNFLTSLAVNGSFYLNPTQDQLQGVLAHMTQSAGQGKIQGTVFNDRNYNNTFESGEQALSGFSVQVTKDGQTTPDQSVVTDQTGSFTVGNLCEGTYHVAIEKQPAWLQLLPSDQNGYTVTLTNSAQTFTDANFALTSASVPTPQPTRLSFTVLLDGIGAASDENGVSNKHPQHTTHTMIAHLYTLSGTVVTTVSGTLTYDPGNGAFVGNIDTLYPLKDDPYVINVAVDHYIPNNLPANRAIHPHTTNELLPVDLYVGDANNDKKLDILDYNLLLDCYSSFRPKTSCDDTKKAATDFNDDGIVDQRDYTLFLNEIKKQNHQ